MTLHELSIVLGKSEKTLKTNFVRTKHNLEKKGIIILKTGCGKNAEYTIIYKENQNDKI